MITVYEIKDNGFLGQSKQIDPKEGVGFGWTYTAPPSDGIYKWEENQWVQYPAEHDFVIGVDTTEAEKYIRDQRNAKLAECDWTQSKDIPEEISAKWAPYRQALRDLPSQEGFPFNVVWPTLEQFAPIQGEQNV